MVKHMVMWSFKEEIPEEKKPELKAQIKEHLEGLVGVVPGLIKAEVVTDLLPSSTRDLCLITELESAEALAAYAVNPNHVHVADTYVRPNVCDRVAMDLELSDLIARLGVQGKSSIAFVIGGSLGLSDAVLKRADYKLSFSRMTFPHQLMQMILLEQIYRGYRIMNHEPYHK